MINFQPSDGEPAGDCSWPQVGIETPGGRKKKGDFQQLETFRNKTKHLQNYLQVRRKKGGEEGSVMKAEDIEGYRGKEDIDAILSFIEAEVKTGTRVKIKM